MVDLSSVDFVIVRRELPNRHGTLTVFHTLVTSNGLAYKWHKKYNGWDRCRRDVAVDDEGAHHVSWAVLKLFGSPRPGTAKQYYACHKDDDRSNNDISNLYWGTPSSNISDSYNNGRDGYLCTPWLTEEVKEQMALMRKAGASYETIALRFMIGRTTVWRILKEQGEVNARD